MTKPDIRAAIDARLRASVLSADEVLALYAQRARTDAYAALEPFLDVSVDEDGRGVWLYDWTGAKTAGKLQLLIEFVRCGCGDATKMMVDAQTDALDKSAMLSAMLYLSR